MKQFPRYVIAVALLAFVLKAIVPAGFMPGESSDGKIEIVICSGEGAVTELVDLKDSPFPQNGDQKQTSSHDTCPYAPVLAHNMAGDFQFLTPEAFEAQKSFPLDPVHQGRVIKSYEAQAPPLSLT